ncbi:hypothetical protein E4U55_000368 [Claviceps digitariae]|nr:hypothetical protein E4U55_000368 [Claviceps digitariae]
MDATTLHHEPLSPPNSVGSCADHVQIVPAPSPPSRLTTRDADAPTPAVFAQLGAGFATETSN